MTLGAGREPAAPLARALPWRQDLLAFLAIQAVFWAGFSGVRRTNFAGYDEWVHISLLAKGIISFPYANRPLMLLWSLPVRAFSPLSLGGFFLTYTFYLSVFPWLLYRLVREVWPGHGSVALLAGIVAAVWAPADGSRLSTVALITYPGATFGTLLAVLLLLRSWRAARPSVLLLASLLAFATARSFEAVIPLLALAPTCLRPFDPRRRAWLWVAVWESAVALALALTLAPLLRGASGLSYQSTTLGLDADPVRVSGRLLGLYKAHLWPLLSGLPEGLFGPAAAVAVVALALAWICWRKVSTGDTDGGGTASLAVMLASGLVAAGLAYAPLALSRSVVSAARTEILSAPGIGLALAAAIGLVTAGLGPRARSLARLLMAAWLVALGAAHTRAMQRGWDPQTYYSMQAGMLRQLRQSIPDVKPNTLLLLSDEAGAWPSAFGFKHAIDYLYEGHAVGSVWGLEDFLYSTRFEADGVRVSPAPSIRGPWRVGETLHRYDEVLLVGYRRSQGLSVLLRWPAALPELPSGARYDPMSCIVPRVGPGRAVVE